MRELRKKKYIFDKETSELFNHIIKQKETD